MPRRQQRQHQFHPCIHVNHSPLVHSRLANGNPLQRHLHINLGKAHTSYIRLRLKSRSELFRELQQQQLFRALKELREEISCSEALKEKICLSGASYFLLAVRNEILVILFKRMFFCFFSCAKKRKSKTLSQFYITSWILNPFLCFKKR